MEQNSKLKNGVAFALGFIVGAKGLSYLMHTIYLTLIGVLLYVYR